MSNNPKDNHDHNHDPDSSDAANDNGTPAEKARAVIPTSAHSALTSLAALTEVLNGVDTASVAGRSGMPMLQFKRDGSGTWVFGQKRTVVEDGSRWAVNPTSFKYGFICFNDNNKPTERLVPISQPKPNVTELPDTGFEWTEQWAVNLKCLDGVDAGTEVVFKPTTVGGIQAVTGSIDAVRDRLNGGQHDGKIVPVVHLEKDSYQHPQYGRIWNPVLAIVDWISLDGPAPAPKPAAPTPPPPSAPQPRRRRVA